jgi:ABC-type Fe3+/spermidine/putrescine transport system ATPase subunit
MTRLTLERLTKRYPGAATPAVEGLDLDLPGGSLTALLGPSGCGKTTTMKMIAGLLRPTAGDIRFDGRSILQTPAEHRGAVMVFQNYLLFPYMSVAENVGFGLRMRRLDRAAIDRRVEAMLARVRLSGFAGRRPAELSGGQQQRVALARALVVEPKLLLLDEPLSNLDAHLRFEMRDLIRTLQREMAITTVFVTPDQEEAVVLADRIALILDGRLQQYDQPPAFFERPASRRIARFFGGVNFFSGTAGGGWFESAIGRFRLPQAQAAAQGEGVLTIRPEEVRIGDEAENTLDGRIASLAFLGTHARFKVMAGDQPIELITAPALIKAWQEGDRIRLALPAEKLWLLPPD